LAFLKPYFEIQAFLENKKYLSKSGFFNKKQMCDSVFMGKENASKNWNCIVSMFLTSFDTYI